MHVCMKKEEAHVNMYSICFAHRVCMYMYVLYWTHTENWTKWPFMSFFVTSLPPNNISSTIYLYVCMYLCICVCMCVFFVKRIASTILFGSTRWPVFTFLLIYLIGNRIWVTATWYFFCCLKEKKDCAYSVYHWRSRSGGEAALWQRGRS